jgi:hypothetical protein
MERRQKILNAAAAESQPPQSGPTEWPGLRRLRVCLFKSLLSVCSRLCSVASPQSQPPKLGLTKFSLFWPAQAAGAAGTDLGLDLPAIVAASLPDTEVANQEFGAACLAVGGKVICVPPCIFP